VSSSTESKDKQSSSSTSATSTSSVPTVVVDEIGENVRGIIIAAIGTLIGNILPSSLTSAIYTPMCTVTLRKYNTHSTFFSALLFDR
jgi:hypothetical protein